MPKAQTQAPTETKPADELQAAGQADQEQQPPRLGTLIYVRVAPGLELVNNETGRDFEPDTDTMQTVTVTTLRRLADGDLVRVADPVERPLKPI